MKQYKITENNITYDIIEYSDGGKYWYLNGKLHREDGPADESLSGNRRWYKNGLLHRDDGPAIIYYNGERVWFKNGLYHRDNGPAIELYNGSKEYWYNGNHLKNINSDEDLKRYIKLLSIS